MKRHFIVTSIIIFLMLSAGLGTSLESTVTELSEPMKTEKIINDFSPDKIEAGKVKTFTLTLKNPYEGDMGNLSFSMGIYQYESYEPVNISDIEYPPTLSNRRKTSLNLTRDGLGSKDTWKIKDQIYTRENTKYGKYRMRFSLEFDYIPTGNHTIMKSKGCFKDSTWDEALGASSPLETEYYAGKINITHLGINGVLSEDNTIFEVKEEVVRQDDGSIPPETLYLMAGIIIGAAALVIYVRRRGS